jgi:uncharacterized protein YerC
MLLSYIYMKRKAEDLSEQEIITTLDTLYTAAAGVKGRAAIKLFLRDLLTPSERIMLGRRLIIARLLIAGESYPAIEKRVGVGRATISRVHRWLKDQFPGFEQAIKEMEKEFNRRKEKRLYATNMLYRLKKKYPLHFLLTPVSKK